MEKTILFLKGRWRTALLVLLLYAVGMGESFAQAFTEGNLNYSINGDGVSVTMTGHVDGTGADGSVTIPETVNHDGVSYTVTAIGSNAFLNCTNLESVSLPNSLISIGDYAFRNCYVLNSITIPNSVTDLGTGAFYECSTLASVSLGNSLTSIKSYTFAYCLVLWSITIPESVTTIGNYAFYGCNLLESITIPDAVTSLGSYAISNCISLGSIVIGNGVTTIGDYALSGNATGSNLGSYSVAITMGNSVNTIGDYAFANSALLSIDIPSTVTSIGNNAFSGCSILNTMHYNATNCTIGSNWLYNCFDLNDLTIGENVQVIPENLIKDAIRLEEITVASGNPIFDSRNGCDAVIRTSTNELVMGCINTNIPNSVTSIGNYAFYNRYSLTSMAIPNSVTSIGEYAFSNCTMLSSIDLPNSVTSVGNHAFEQCSSLSSVSISTSLETIGDYVFYQCYNLTSIVIPNSVVSIGNSAFSGCNGLPSVTIPNSVTTIGNNAFSDCSSLVSATIGTSVTTIESSAFGGSTHLISLNYNATNCSIESSWLAENYVHRNPWLYEVTIGENVQHIPDFFVYGCQSLTSVSIPNSVTSTGNYAFYGCSGLAAITIPNSVTSIGNGAFSDCSGITTITIPNSVTTIGASAFANCNITSITIPSTVTSIASHAFSGCPNLTTLNYYATNCVIVSGSGYYDYNVWSPSLANLTIGDNVQTIPDNFVRECSGLTGSLVIPNSVVSIGNSAFFHCSGITSVTIGESVTSIGANAFSDCGITSITIPESVTSIGSEAFRCWSLTTLNYNATNCTFVDGNNTTYSPWYYYNYSSLTNLTIGNNVQVIPDYFVKDCTGLTGNLVIPNSVVSIGYLAFDQCSNLTSVTIGNSVTTIDNWAFRGCSGLSSLTVLTETPPIVNYSYGSSFYFGTTDIHVYVPCGTTSAYLSANGWNEFTNYHENCGPFTINAIANPENGGIVSGGGSYDYDETATLSAVANEGFTFVNWTENGQQLSMETEYTFVVKGDREFVANFTDNPTYLSVSATANPFEGGIVTGDGVYLQGQTATLSAIPNSGFIFLNWTKNGMIVSTESTYSFVVMEEAEYVAHFTELLALQVEIGSGMEKNEYLPSYSYYKYSLTQQIYTADEIGASGGYIEGIAFYNDGATKTRDYTIYMVNTTKTGFNNNHDWITVTEADQVFSGEVDMTADKWTHIALTTPFVYNGTNLALVVADNTGSWSNSPHMQCRVFDADGNQAIYIYSDNTTYNPYSPSNYLGTLLNVKNQIVLGSMVTAKHYPDSGDPNSPYVELAWADQIQGDSLYYDFEEGVPSGWSTIDADNDGYTWRAVVGNSSIPGHDNSTGFVTSDSWVSSNGALTPDNYLVSPQLPLGGIFSFWACAQDANWSAEHFGVAVSTSDNTDASDFTTIQEWTMSAKGVGMKSLDNRSGSRAQGVWYQYVVDLSAYMGQTGYVAIRHFDCTDMFRLNVDDVEYIFIPTYRVYRANCDGNGMEMLADNVTGNQYIDESWVSMVSGTYKYGVCIAGDNNAIAWSNCIEKAGEVVTTYQITATADPAEGGTVSGEGIYSEGDTCTIVATANEGYTFINWMKDGEVVSTSETYSFLVTETGNYIAIFVGNSYTISATANPTEGGIVTIGSDGEILISEPFEEYNVGNKIAAEVLAAGHDWWTTWSNAPGSSEDGIVESFNGSQCGHLTYGNDQVLLLGNVTSGVYDLEFDILVPEGKNGYFNILHDFNGPNSTWAMQCYLHMTTDGQNSTNAPGHGTIHAGSNNTADIPCVYDEWMHFRLHVDTDNDVAQYYYTLGGNEILLCEWQWSLDSFGQNNVGRTLSAMNFYPPTDASSEFYLDNFTFKRFGGESAPEITITPLSVNATLGEDNMSMVEITIDNSGNSIAEWNGYLEFPHSGAGSQTTELCYHNGEQGTGIGSSSSCTREMAMRLPANAYAGAAMGMRIVSAKYLIQSDYKSSDDNYTFRVYGQGTNNQPGELLTQKAVTSTDLGTWIEVTFDDEVYLTGQEMWVSVQLEQAADEYPMTMDGGDYGEEADGNWFSTNGRNFYHCYRAGSYGGAWLITINCQGEPVPATWASINKTGGSIMGGESEVVTLTLNSIGIEQGSYSADFIIETNDVNMDHVEIPISLTVDLNRNDINNSKSANASAATVNGFNRHGPSRLNNVFAFGSTCVLTATPNPGYTFINWTKEGEVVSTNATYSFTVTENAVFVANFSQDQGGETIQTTSLTSGWNWWSTYVEADDLFDQLKTGLGANAQQIKSSTTFVSYFNGMWVGGLNGISNESCYLINANNACTLEMTGNPATPANHPVTINPNWNWIGYPNTGAQSVANAFSNFTPANGDQVKSQNAFATYYGGMWVGGLNTITPGMGLLYKSNSTIAKTLVYPEVSRSEELVENVSNENNHWTADYHAYPSNMTVMAVVELDDVELQGNNYEVAAFANDECRGSARLMYVAPINRYVAFLTIVGDEASELRFSLYDSEMGTVVETCQGASLQYETNATIGSLETPYAIRFRSTTDVDEWVNNINIFPNPVNRGEQFSLGLTAVETLRATSVQIVNAMGVVVETWRAASLQTFKAPDVAGVYTLRISVEGKGIRYLKLVVR